MPPHERGVMADEYMAYLPPMGVPISHIFIEIGQPTEELVGADQSGAYYSTGF